MNGKSIEMGELYRFLPFFSVILVFLGYWDLHFYFVYFDIPIYDYVSTGEIILSFLPKAIYILLYTLLIILSMIITRGSGLTSEPYLRNNYNVLFNSKTPVSAMKKILAALYLLVKITALLMIVYFTIYAVMEWSRSGDSVYSYRVPYVVLIFIWFFLLIQVIDYLIEKRYSVKDELSKHRILIAAMLFLTYLSFIMFSDYSNAVQTLKGYPLYDVEFSYRDKHIRSGKDTVFVGQTNAYLFLRDRHQGVNFIFHKSDLKEMKMKENKYNFIKEDVR